MANHSFRCYAYRQAEGCYVAYCLDLMLIGEGPTMEAAIADMDEAILGHVEAAYKRGWEKELIPRPARPGRWLEFYWLLLSYPFRVLLGGFDNSLFVFRKKEQKGNGNNSHLSAIETVGPPCPLATQGADEWITIRRKSGPYSPSWPWW